MVWIIILVVVAIIVIYLIAAYNGLIRGRNQIENAWSQIDVQLKRRIDLIPNLVETVKAYAEHEKSTLEAVIHLLQQRGSRIRSTPHAATRSPFRWRSTPPGISRSGTRVRAARSLRRVPV